ncbi:hypothetical protein AgCh_030110 [Apium graveolens]
MAIRSAAYIINEEQDGFVAVDFDFINGHDQTDLTAWEFVDQADADVDAGSEEVGDDVSDSDGDGSYRTIAETVVGEDVRSLPDLSMSSDYSDGDDDDRGRSGDVICCVGSARYDLETVAGEDVESLPELSMLPEYFDRENDDCERTDDVTESVDFAGSDAKSVPETIISPEYSDGGEDAKSVTELIISPDYSEETIGENSVPENIISPEYMTEKITGYSESVAAYRSRGDKYRYEEEEDVEEDDYDLDDELVPYYVNNKLGRERMRKLGKRSCAKSVKSKRLTYNYNKAGCFRGKHGLGLKHSLI